MAERQRGRMRCSAKQLRNTFDAATRLHLISLASLDSFPSRGSLWETDCHVGLRPPRNDREVCGRFMNRPSGVHRRAGLRKRRKAPLASPFGGGAQCAHWAERVWFFPLSHGCRRASSPKGRAEGAVHPCRGGHGVRRTFTVSGQDRMTILKRLRNLPAIAYSVPYALLH